MQWALRFVYRHIVRSAFKSFLVAVVTVVFVIVSGFLQVAISRTEKGIDVLPGIVRRFQDNGEAIDDLHIRFAEGCDETSFAFTEGAPVPIIVTEQVSSNISITYTP